MNEAPLRLGTRGSKLAMAQSRQVAEALTARTGRPVELVEVVTAGDRSNAPVHRLGVGVFVSALRDALVAGTIDFAVHSYKDLPTATAAGLHIAAVPPRQDPRDALVARDGRTLAELDPGAVVGTGALRRIAQLHALGMPLSVTPIRGNIDTRLARVLGPEADLDAVVLARAGLTRIDRADVVTETLDPMLMLPAPAQGRWRWSAGSTTPTWSSCSPRSTTHRHAPRSPRSGRCWPPWRPDAPLRSPPTPNSPRARPARRSTCAGR
ncbi:hypothetical protein GCM10029963_55370 [Micromonospora andamanensis]